MLVAAFAVVAAGSVRAQQVRTFVSGHGADSGTCGVAAPCRSFAYALTQTSTGGEIVVQDAAGYGSLVIGKAISIVNDSSGEAAVSPASGSAIVINGGAADVVNLRGLTMVGNGVGTYGIVWNSGASLNIQNCTIRGFVDDGLLYRPAGNSNLTILDMTSSGNGGDGIRLEPPPSGSQEHLYLQEVRAVYNQSNGIEIDALSGQSGSIQAVIRSSSIIQNHTNGIALNDDNSSAGSRFSLNIDFVDDDLAENADDGFVVQGGPLTGTISGSIITNNAEYGIFVVASLSDSTFYTLNNNIISGNTMGSLGNLTLTSQAQ